MKRPLIFSSFLVGIISLSFLTLFNILCIILACSYTADMGDMFAAVLAIFIVLLAVGIVALVLNSCSIAYINKSQEEFNHRKPVMISAIVFNFIIAVLTITITCVEPTWFIIIVGILFFLAILTSAVLAIFGVSVKPNESDIEENAKVEFKKEDSQDELNKKLVKLAEMRDKGLLTEEEFTKFKQNYIKQYILK